MAEETKMMNDEDDFMRYFKRIREEVKKILDKKGDARKYAGSAGWLLARYGMNKDPEYAEEAATYILAATFLERGKK